MPTKNELFLKFTDYCSEQYAKVSDKKAFLIRYDADIELNRLINMAEREDDYENVGNC
jgi:hypothetical protein